MVEEIKGKVGFEVKNMDTVYNSSYNAAQYLKTYHPEKKKVYAYGSENLKDELEMAGFDVISS